MIEVAIQSFTECPRTDLLLAGGSNTYRRPDIDSGDDGKLRLDVNKHVTTVLFTPVVGSD